MAFESNLPAAYHDEETAVSVLGTDHLVALDYAEPSGLMLFASRWWRRPFSIRMADSSLCGRSREGLRERRCSS